MLKKLLARLKREPLLSRAGLAAALNILVVAGVLDANASAEVSEALLGAVNAAILLSARSKVTPVVPVVVPDPEPVEPAPAQA